jgi:hypothetical protein
MPVSARAARAGEVPSPVSIGCPWWGASDSLEEERHRRRLRREEPKGGSIQSMSLTNLASRFSISDVLALVSIAAGFLIYFLQRSRRSLGYRVFDVRPVAPPDFDRPSPPEHDIAIEYVNLGNVPLVASDFVSPLTTEFPGSGAVVASRCFRSALGANTPSQVRHSGTEGVVLPPLLNPGESVRAEFRVRKFGGQVRVRARVAGVTGVANVAVSSLCWMYATAFAGFYIAFLANRIRTHEAVDHYFFLLLMTPFTILAVVQVSRVVRAQCLGWAFRPTI